MQFWSADKLLPAANGSVLQWNTSWHGGRILHGMTTTNLSECDEQTSLWAVAIRTNATKLFLPLRYI